MTDAQMPKTYDFASTEQRLYEWWWRSGWFKPEATRDQSAEPFVISIPPPNVTGELHWGHAMFVSVEDLMIRYARMQGYRTLWVPGMDHAGIATQLQVEKHLLRTEEVTKDELGREEFVKRVWDWKAKYGGIIQTQIRRLGLEPAVAPPPFVQALLGGSEVVGFGHGCFRHSLSPLKKKSRLR